jgi:hypothetical protein
MRLTTHTSPETMRLGQTDTRAIEAEGGQQEPGFGAVKFKAIAGGRTAEHDRLMADFRPATTQR